MKEILIEKTGYYHQGKYFKECEVDVIRKYFNRKLNICILCENVFVNIVDKTYMDLESCLLNFEKDNLIDEDTLVHYEYDKKLKVLYIYSIKQGQRVYKLANNIRRINVYPIQFKIKNLICKNTKEYEFFSVVLFREYVYTIEVKNKIIVSSSCALEVTFCLDDHKDTIQKYDKFVIDKALHKKLKASLDTIKDDIISINLEEIMS